jgi:hypothetical protein
MTMDWDRICDTASLSAISFQIADSSAVTSSMRDASLEKKHLGERTAAVFAEIRIPHIGLIDTEEMIDAARELEKGHSNADEPRHGIKIGSF